MSAAQRFLDEVTLIGLVPLNTLPTPALARLLKTAKEVQLAPGETLFERGDATPCTYYVLAGEVALNSPVYPEEVIQGGTEAARYPLAHHLPRQVSARARTKVWALALPLDILDVMHNMAQQQAAAPPQEHLETWKARWLKSPLLRRLPQDNIRAVFARMEEIKGRAGQVIIEQDGDADAYYVIKTGRCGVWRRPAPRAQAVKLAELGAGQGFGEEALITNGTRNASVTLLEDGRLLRLSKRDFIDLLARPMVRHVPFDEALKMAESGAVLVDVRSPEEFESDGLIGALSMPMPVLRLKANRLDPQQSYIVYSNTGQFSSAAAFLLAQQGMDAYVLKGGLNAAPPHRRKRSPSHGDSARTAPGRHGRGVQFCISPARGRDNAQIDPAAMEYNTVSDDVLWQTALGYRQDRRAESLLDGGERDDDIDLDELQLFTSIPTPPRHVPDTETRPNPFDTPAQARAPTPEAHPATARLAQAALRRARRRSRIPQVIALLGLLAIAALYVTNDDVRERLNGIPHWIQQQEALNDKLDRLLKFVETLPALKHAAPPAAPVLQPPPAPAGGNGVETVPPPGPAAP
ncbi:MAG TPA: cyclic nucleotide-binding domain-containing protein [Anaerolineae bacterium]|nr:cyclic nucleotide-binding domain-containing protein [Anaerolineae bacterium]